MAETRESQVSATSAGNQQTSATSKQCNSVQASGLPKCQRRFEVLNSTSKRVNTSDKRIPEEVEVFCDEQTIERDQERRPDHLPLHQLEHRTNSEDEDEEMIQLAQESRPLHANGCPNDQRQFGPVVRSQNRSRGSNWTPNRTTLDGATDELLHLANHRHCSVYNQRLQHKPTCSLLYRHNHGHRHAHSCSAMAHQTATNNPTKTGESRSMATQAVARVQTASCALNQSRLSANKQKPTRLDHSSQLRVGKQIVNLSNKQTDVHQFRNYPIRETLLASSSDYAKAAQLRKTNQTQALVPSATNKSTTSIKFIPQLYFLIHLSALISLLLHHKNLVSSELRLAIQQQSGAANVEEQLNNPTFATKRNVVDLDQLRHGLDEPSSQSLPEPQTYGTTEQSAHHYGRHRYDSSATLSETLSEPQRLRAIRASFLAQANVVAVDQKQIDASSSDILVRLIGRPNAKRALQYFLCYLLASSIGILVLLWLFRLLGPINGQAQRKLLATNNEEFSKQSSRQDCTPVLIGSISLGLIQLIVVGLDIADHADLWLYAGDLPRQWPVLLPFLQFVFVSLLMQFILAQIELHKKTNQVAKNRDPIKTYGGVGGKEKRHDSWQASPINRRHKQSIRRSSSGENLQNIALAHLLVTHILLWLMRLNSISLFEQQTGEQQVIAVAPINSNHLANNRQRKFELQANNENKAPDLLETKPKRKLATQTQVTPTIDLSSDSRASNETIPVVIGRVEADSRVGGSSSTNATINQKATSRDEQVKKPILRDTESAPTNQTDQQRDAIDGRPPLVESSNGLAKSERDSRSASRPTRVIDQVPINLKDAHGQGDSASTSSPAKQGASQQSSPTQRPVFIDHHSMTSTSTSVRPTPSTLVNEQQSSSTKVDGPTTTSSTTSSPISSTTRTRNALDLGSPNISANLFKSSLPKRMTAFRQGRPSQRVNLSPPKPKSSSSTTQLPVEPSNKMQQTTAPIAKHKVRVFVSRDEPSSNSIDLSAVIPVNRLNENRADEEEKEVELPTGLESPTSSSSTTSRPSSSSSSGTPERPFPSVEQDPPVRIEARPDAAIDYKAAASIAKKWAPEQKSNEEVRRTNTSLAAEHQSGILKKSLEALNEQTQKDSDLSAADYEEDPNAFDDGPEVDLDALLPPVPNYELNNTTTSHGITSSQDSSDGMRHTTDKDDESVDEEAELLADDLKHELRSPMKTEIEKKALPKVVHKLKSPTNDRETLRQLALLDNEAFVFNEAASSQHNSTTANPLKGIRNRTRMVGLESIGISAALVAGNEHRRDSSWFQQQQQQQQQQPTFSDFLLPIVQQYHILVLTILFNMWLDSMQTSVNPSEASTKDSIDQRLKHNLMVSRRQTRRPILMPRGHLSEDQIELAQSSGLSRSSSLTRLSLISPSEFAGQPLDLDSSSPDSNSQPPAELELDQIRSAKLELARRNIRAGNQMAPPVERLDSSANSSSSSTLVDSTITFVNRDQRNSSLFWRKRDHARWRRHLEPGQNCSKRRQFASHLVTNHRASQHQLQQQSQHQQQQQVGTSGSVCSVFFGLLVVSCSLIVILVGLDLLSMLAQCAIQMISILVCLLGLCSIWRYRRSFKLPARLCNSSAIPRPHQNNKTKAANHKDSFHCFFLLAAYFCGISIALNLGQQYQMARLFPQQVIKFLQRHFAPAAHLIWPTDSFERSEEVDPIRIINYQLLFHLTLIFKGLVLIVQVTLQTLLIRLSWAWPFARNKLRQLYNFLMFTNLSLWALEICDQQQQLQLDKLNNGLMVGAAANQAGLIGWQTVGLSSAEANGSSLNYLTNHRDFELLSLNGFTHFCGSVVTLSHLYHGLVFMQH